MAIAKTCQDEAKAVERAKDKKSDTRFLSKERKAAKKDIDKAKDRLKACKKDNSSDRAIIMARGMARAAADAGVKFPLKRDWHKGVGLGKKDNEIESKLKVKNVEDAVEYINKFAGKNDLKQAAGNAVALEALYDLKRNVSGGFISAQIALGIMDIVATVLSLGTYAAVAPAVHTAVGAGQKVSLSVIQKDIDAAEASTTTPWLCVPTGWPPRSPLSLQPRHRPPPRARGRSRSTRDWSSGAWPQPAFWR